MKFGKEFQIHLEESLPEWRDKYLCYKPLKKLLKNVPTSGDSALYNPQPTPSADLQDCFINTLNEELKKFNDFYVDKEEDFIIRFQDEFLDLHLNSWVRRLNIDRMPKHLLEFHSSQVHLRAASAWKHPT